MGPRSQRGASALTILLLWTTQQDRFLTWRVSASELFSPDSSFEGVKEAYLYATIHTEVNPQWQIAMNKSSWRRSWRTGVK